MNNQSSFQFTSESVSMGHPDKMADQISDSILDAMLAVDPRSRVACETMVTTGMAVIAGEVTCDGYVEIAELVRETVLDIGYDDGAKGFDGKSCAVLVSLDQQSPDIAQGVNEGDGMHKEQGAGDQGLMFGFRVHVRRRALMPLTIDLSHKIWWRSHAEVRRIGDLIPHLRPDAKSAGHGGVCNGFGWCPHAAAVWIRWFCRPSTVRNGTTTSHALREAVIEHIIKPVLR